MLRSLIVLAVLAAPVCSQAASFLTFGTPCATTMPPALAAVTLPRIGSTFVVETTSRGVSGYEGNGTTFLAAGASRSSWQGMPLPLTPAAFALFGVFGCGELSIAPDVIVMAPLTLSPQPVRIPVGIPNDPSLIGVSVYLQPFVVEPSRRGALVLTFGLAGEARIGT